MNEDRRTTLRLRSRLTIFVKVLSTGKVQRALTKDMGGKGVCVIMDQPLEPGTKLELELELPDRASPITCTAEVVWSRPLKEVRKSYEPSTSEIGVKFLQIDPKDLALITQYAKLNAMPSEPDA